MKKVFFAALAVTFMFASCNKEDNGIPEGKDAKLIVQVETPSSKATGTAATGDATITGYEILVFDVNGGNVGYTSGTATTQEVTTNTNASEVYVIANAPAGLFSAGTTKTALLAYTTDLDQATAANSQYTKRWATGSSAVSAFVQSGADFVATATVVMKFIAARITVTIDNQMQNYIATATDGSFVLKGVSVLNATSASKLYGTSLVSGTSYYAGTSMSGFAAANIPATYTVKSFLKDAITAGIPNTNGYHFYVFENAATAANDYPTIVMVEGEYENQPIYFPVHLAAYEQFSTGSMSSGVLRGNSYNLTFKLSGDARFSEGGSYPGDTGGTEDPTIPSGVTAKCTVTLSINDWTPVNLVKEF